MDWIFKIPQDLRGFAIYLIGELEKINERVLAQDLKEWIATAFPTSSEFLGEFRIILEKILNTHRDLRGDLRQNICSAVNVINRAFGQH